ncbi:hypothetical protein GDO81_019101 [Engystomops pustulosus]|uniref:Uncharacterized protein n=1 Tax=Engystomops pustulosus TaxID=76066 RepID=A0AAV6ZA77_ENGPU|nr:hypothetical protein GDO81_019101 [Engystomops pustulosus]
MEPTALFTRAALVMYHVIGNPTPRQTLGSLIGSTQSVAVKIVTMVHMRCRNLRSPVGLDVPAVLHKTLKKDVKVMETWSAGGRMTNATQVTQQS